MRKIFSITVTALILVISVPLVLGALTYQRDIFSNGTTTAYNWNNKPNLTLTAFGTQTSNVQLSITANSTKTINKHKLGNTCNRHQRQLQPRIPGKRTCNRHLNQRRQCSGEG